MTKGIQRLFIKNNTAFFEPFFDNTAFSEPFFALSSYNMPSLISYSPIIYWNIESSGIRKFSDHYSDLTEKNNNNMLLIHQPEH